MHSKMFKDEKGQILVVLVLALIGLLAFTALAVDLGMVFSDRRYDQNVADASALAAAEKAALALKLNQYFDGTNVVDGIDFFGFVCGPSANQWSDSQGWTPPEFLTESETLSRPILYDDILAAAVNRAATNNMDIEYNDISTQNGVVMRCVELANQGNVVDRHLEFRVLVSGVTNASFAYHVFGAPLRNTVEALSHVEPTSPIGFGNSILALNSTLDCQHVNIGSILFDGGPSVVTVGGSIVSNRCMKTQAGNAYVRVLEDPDNPDSCIEDTITYMYTTGQPLNADICPHPEPMTYPVPRHLFDPPLCGEMPYMGSFRQHSPGAANTIDPGRYDSITVTKGDLTLNPGLYCISGDFSFNGGSITTPAGHTDTTFTGCGETDPKCGVTIWMDSTNGSLTLNGNGEMSLTSPISKANLWAHSLPNLLIGAPDTYVGTVDIEGNQDDTFIGGIYLPYGELTIGGTSNTGTSDPLSDAGPNMFTQLIADRIKFHGSTTINIVYDENRKIWGSASLHLAK